MSRCKDIKRVEKAIKERDIIDLQWADIYCNTRLLASKREEAQNHWSGLLTQVRSALEQAKSAN